MFQVVIIIIMSLACEMNAKCLRACDSDKVPPGAGPISFSARRGDDESSSTPEAFPALSSLDLRGEEESDTANWSIHPEEGKNML